MSALMDEKSYNLPLQEYLRDIGCIDPSEDYFKSELALMWNRDRRTINRWQQIAIDHAPLFSTAFDYVYHYADCPNCGKSFRLSDIDNRKAQRGWSISCPHCETRSQLKPKTEVGTNSALKIPGQYAKVLRFVGCLVSHLGTDRAIALLTTDDDGKPTRQFIRHLLKP